MTNPVSKPAVTSHQYALTSVCLAFTLLSVPVLGGCDKVPNQPNTAPATVPAAPPPSAPTPAAVVPTTAPAPAVVAAPTGPSLEVQSHIKQAFAYISMAKNAQGTLREENIDNALREFSQAVEKDPNYAEAYSNRSIAYMQQKKFNKAEDDLRRAKELAPNSPSVRYNYACLHSLKADVDLALDEIDAALAKGFSDYDALRLDPDLNNVRKHPEFRKILEKHKIFIIK